MSLTSFQRDSIIEKSRTLWLANLITWSHQQTTHPFSAFFDSIALNLHRNCYNNKHKQQIYNNKLNYHITIKICKYMITRETSAAIQHAKRKRNWWIHANFVARFTTNEHQILFDKMILCKSKAVQRLMDIFDAFSSKMCCLTRYH